MLWGVGFFVWVCMKNRKYDNEKLLKIIWFGLRSVKWFFGFFLFLFDFVLSYVY